MQKTVIIFLLFVASISSNLYGQEIEPMPPISYEEAVGKDIIQLENEFFSTIHAGTGLKYGFDITGYENAGGHFYKKEGTSYYLDSVRNDSYAEEKKGKLMPLISTLYPEESIMTLFTVPNAATGFSIELVHHKYGFVEDKYLVNLADFLVSCMDSGCEPYVGIESDNGDKVIASLFMVNKEQGYNHVLRAVVPKSSLKSASGCITSDIYTYVPAHNISSLFAK